MQPFIPPDPDRDLEAAPKATRDRLVRERRVEVFLQLDQHRTGLGQASREQAMKGGTVKAIYYVAAALFFILYGALF